MHLHSAPSTGILLIAHAPLATALKTCAVHMQPEYERFIVAYDVAPKFAGDIEIKHGLSLARQLEFPQILMMTDIIGATPYNLCQTLLHLLTKEATDKPVQLVSGANIPMLLRALTYREKPLDELVKLVVAGGIKGIQHVMPHSL